MTKLLAILGGILLVIVEIIIWLPIIDRQEVADLRKNAKRVVVKKVAGCVIFIAAIVIIMLAFS